MIRDNSRCLTACFLYVRLCVFDLGNKDYQTYLNWLFHWLREIQSKSCHYKRDCCSTRWSWCSFSYLDAWLWKACGLGQVLSEADARVRVSRKGGTQELHVFFGEACPLPAAGAARGAAAGGRRFGIIWERRNNRFYVTDLQRIIPSLPHLHSWTTENLTLGCITKRCSSLLQCTDRERWVCTVIHIIINLPFLIALNPWGLTGMIAAYIFK